jgi:transposase-like protein
MKTLSCPFCLSTETKPSSTNKYGSGRFFCVQCGAILKVISEYPLRVLAARSEKSLQQLIREEQRWK